MAHGEEFAFASRQPPAIEINSTCYRTQRPQTFEAWARETPPGFIFSVKGPRYATNRRVLAEAGDSVRRFMHSGVTSLGSRLGPTLWQFSPMKRFEEIDFGRFVECLPRKFERREIRHVVEVRHPSFATPAFISLVRSYDIPVVCADHVDYPAIADVTGDFVYLRLMKGDDGLPAAYPPKEIALWASRAKAWAKGDVPSGLAVVDKQERPERQPRDVFVYFVHEGKVRAPAAARAFMGSVYGRDVRRPEKRAH